MIDDEHFRRGLFAGLKALAVSAFPKRCAACGRVFETAEAFLQETDAIDRRRSGLKQACDDDGRTIVEAFRNCPCGSTLMTSFGDRRDMSAAGLARRRHFGELLALLEARGVDHDTAHREVLKLLRGEPSELIAGIAPPEEPP